MAGSARSLALLAVRKKRSLKAKSGGREQPPLAGGLFLREHRDALFSSLKRAQVMPRGARSCRGQPAKATLGCTWPLPPACGRSEPQRAVWAIFRRPRGERSGGSEPPRGIPGTAQLPRSTGETYLLGGARIPAARPAQLPGAHSQTCRPSKARRKPPGEEPAAPQRPPPLRPRNQESGCPGAADGLPAGRIYPLWQATRERKPGSIRRAQSLPGSASL